jgi:hypothetical protein
MFLLDIVDFCVKKKGLLPHYSRVIIAVADRGTLSFLVCSLLGPDKINVAMNVLADQFLAQKLRSIGVSEFEPKHERTCKLTSFASAA